MCSDILGIISDQRCNRIETNNELIRCINGVFEEFIDKQTLIKSASRWTTA